MTDLTKQAINAALSRDWNKAVTINKAILDEKQDDIEALTRLAYAFIQVGKIEQAKKTYKKILALDRFNFIAQKNLDKLKALPKNIKNISQSTNNAKISPNMFIEEPGKTKSVSLTYVAPITILSNLHIGDQVFLCPKKHSIEIRDQNNTYLGALPDDIAFRLIRFLKARNVYQAWIKNVQKNNITIFIKEIKRGKRFLNQPSFPSVLHEFNPSTPKIFKSHLREENEAENQEEVCEE